MKKIILILLIVILVSCATPTQKSLLASLARVTITQNNTTYTCTQPVAGVTVNASGVTVQNCTVTGDSSNAGGIAVNGSNNTILNNVITGACMAGIIVRGDDNLIQGNEISKSKQCAGTSGPDADGIRYFNNGNVIVGNYIHDILYDSVNTTAHIDCFQTWGGASNTVIENNICDNATNNATLAGSGANIENDTGAIFRNNYFRIAGKQIMVESSSSNTVIERNIFISGPVIPYPPYQYGIFGSGSNETANNNIFFGKKSENGTSFLLGVSNISGNLIGVDPKMDGYCSLAYPNIGIPCGGTTATPTITPTMTVTATKQPQISTETGIVSITPSATIPPTATKSATPTKTRTPIPTKTFECILFPVHNQRVCLP